MTDAIAILERLRPDDSGFDPDAPAARAGLERILASPPARRPPRLPVRRLAVVAGAVAAAVAVVVLTPFVRGGSGDVIARAAAALNQPGTILHLDAEIRVRDTRAEERSLEPDGRVDTTMEIWQTAGGRQERVVYDDALEFAEDWDTKSALSYEPDRNRLVRITDPEWFDPEQRVPPDADGFDWGTGNVSDDLAELLDRARRGEENLRLVGETTIRGIPVHELRIEHTVDTVVRPVAGEEARDLPDAVEIFRVIYVDRETFLPVRLLEGGPGEQVNSITDFHTAERLPRTAENERLLRMSPHPGAERLIVEDLP
jgi:hypothetical protein